MGLALDTDNPYGLVGVGYPAIEAIDPNVNNPMTVYPNLPQELVSEGIISTAAYSLWLNDLGILHSLQFPRWPTICIESISMSIMKKGKSVGPPNLGTKLVGSSS